VLIQSSVAYQALQMGLQVYVFKQDYYEASYDIFDEPSVTLAENWKEMSSIMKKRNSLVTPRSSIFFEPYDPAVIKEVCSDLKVIKLSA